MTKPESNKNSSTRKLGVSAAAALLIALCACGEPPPNRGHEVTLHSPVFTVDRIYHSMEGPIGSFTFDLLRGVNKPELVWLTGFRSVVVDENSRRRLPQSFMCHSNLVYQGLGEHRRKFRGRSLIRKDKLFTISQGEEKARFPEGFGMPVITNMPRRSFRVYNQLLNVNYKNFRKPLKLRYRNTMYFVRESERTRKIRPLYQALGQVMVALDDKSATFNVLSPSAMQSQASCSGGDSASPLRVKDRHGREFTYHWKLKPGREVRKTLITGTMLKLEEDTTIHYIVSHMHPYGESLALKDLTTNKVLFKSNMVNYKDRIGIAKVDHYSSKKGIPVYKDHEYALISTYNNTTKKTHDAMAIMYFFLHDKRFRPPDNI